MRQHKLFLSAFTIILLAFFPTFLLADVNEIYTRFNAMNSGQGYLFQARINPMTYWAGRAGEIRLTNAGDTLPSMPGYDFLSGYNTSSNRNTAFNGGGMIDEFYFQTFCVAPEFDTDFGQTRSGTLNYQSVTHTTATAMGNNLKLGVAWLYKEFAAGTLGAGTEFAYEYVYGQGRIDSAVMLQDAIWFLMGGMQNEYAGRMTDRDTDWDNNTYLKYLKSIEDEESYWRATYQVGNSYDGLMGDYNVYVVNVKVPSFMGFGGDTIDLRQDVLYVIRDNDPHTPEPASILLWTLGSLGAAGMVYRKRRTNLNLEKKKPPKKI